MCKTELSPFSLSPLLRNLGGLRLVVGSELKNVGIADGGKSDKSIECLSTMSYQKQTRSLTGLLFR